MMHACFFFNQNSSVRVGCSDEKRICNVATTIEKKPWRTDMTVFIVNEDLGLS
jgi:hypothetical protein